MAATEPDEIPDLPALLMLVTSTHDDVGSDFAKEAFRRDLADWLDGYESEDLDDEDGEID